MQDLLTVLDNIKQAVKYLTVVIPAKAGMQVVSGCRIKSSGMTEFSLYCHRVNNNDPIWKRKEKYKNELRF
jgi:hypothetical protein